MKKNELQTQDWWVEKIANTRGASLDPQLITLISYNLNSSPFPPHFLLIYFSFTSRSRYYKIAQPAYDPCWDYPILIRDLAVQLFVLCGVSENRIESIQCVSTGCYQRLE